MGDLAFSCNCGATYGVLRGADAQNGNHAQCFCTSCRAADIYCGAPDPEDGGITVYQTTPDRIEFTAGQDQLKVFSFGPNNLLRWQAGCCGALLFNSLRRPKFAFAGLRSSRLEDISQIGPVTSQGFVIGSDGKQRHHGKLALVGGAVARALTARLSGRWKITPFFDSATLQPVRKPYVLSKSERQALIPTA